MMQKLLSTLDLLIELVPLFAVMSFGLIGVLWYLAHGRLRSRRVSALAHIVRRLTAREMRENVLHSELKRILMERDEIVADRFDHLVTAADVFDLTGPQTVEGLFGELSRRLSERTGLTAGQVGELAGAGRAAVLALHHRLDGRDLTDEARITGLTLWAVRDRRIRSTAIARSSLFPAKI